MPGQEQGDCSSEILSFRDGITFQIMKLSDIFPRNIHLMTQFRTILRCSYVSIKSQENVHNLATWDSPFHEGRTAPTESKRWKQVPSDRFDKAEEPRTLSVVPPRAHASDPFPSSSPHACGFCRQPRAFRKWAWLRRQRSDRSEQDVNCLKRGNSWPIGRERHQGINKV